MYEPPEPRPHPTNILQLHTSDFHLKRSTPGDRLCYWGGCDYKGRRDNFQTHMFRHHFKDLPHREMCVCGYFQESLYLARLHVRVSKQIPLDGRNSLLIFEK